VTHAGAGGGEDRFEVEVGCHHRLGLAGRGDDLAGGIHDFGIGGEAQRSEGAVLVGCHPDDLVVESSGPVEQVELAGPAVERGVWMGVGGADRPG
jgi:hypothetical protein